MKNFITNTGAKDLKKRLVELIRKSRELKFLVGFFYFSGIRELYEGLKDNPDVNIKVLVGLNVDRTVSGLLEVAYSENYLSDEERCYRFLQSVKKSINSEDFDSREFYEQVRFFIHLIKEDRLIIRKTFNPNHAKLYIFKLEEGQVGRRSLFITGSSNLTRAGITTQDEFNVEISDYGVEDAEDYFDALWDRAVMITEDDVIKQRLIYVVEKETLIKDISPFEAYALVLKTYIESYEQRGNEQSIRRLMEKSGYKPYQYQIDAIKQALAIIERNNGVIIADVVGLGKTVIACAVAGQLNKRGIVICPPGLVGDKNKNSGWLKYMEEFGLYDWEVRSLGDLENVSEFISRAKDIDVVIVDEAHRFRNQDTKDYEYLKNICRGKTVILLTATPFNNRPADIFSLLKLFITPKKSTITLTDNLEARFREFKGTFDRLSYIKRYANSSDPQKRQRAATYYKALFGKDVIDLRDVNARSHYLARQIKDVIEPVTIRRNRLDLQGNPYYQDEVYELSRVEDPVEWFFELSEGQSRFYDRVINQYFALPEDGGLFKGAIYRPFIYKVGIDAFDELEREENFQYIQQFNLYDFMRRLLVKRFESSFGAFRQSLENFKDITEIVLAFIKKTCRYILDRRLLERIYDMDIDEIEEHLKEYAERIKRNEYSKHHEIYEIDKFKDRKRFLSNIESDKRLFESILDELNSLDLISHDPKAETLINNIKETLSKKPGNDEPKRKVVVFSEYTDTVKYLAPILEDKFDKRVLVVAGNLTKSKVEEIYRNFDASMTHEKQADDYDILLTTDKISEGFNLNRAGMVINYDIPWNPVRVIQRVGRINRISKKVFTSLYIANFFPTEKGADLVRSREIAGNKMFLIHNALGEDSKIFDIDEEPSPSGLYTRLQQNPDYLEGESFFTRVLKEFEKIRSENPALVEQLNDFPSRIKVAKRSDRDELFVVIKKGRLFVHHIEYNDDPRISIIGLEDCLERIRAERDEPPLPLSDIFWDRYEEIKNYRELTRQHLTAQSIQQKAINNLKSILKISDNDELTPLKDFVRTLLEDILDYGTLSDYTLRRLSNLDVTRPAGVVKELKKLGQELGGDYLEGERQRLKFLSKEIIIAIENRIIEDALRNLDIIENEKADED